MCKIEFTKNALEDLRYLNRFEQNLIVDVVEKQLLWKPTTQIRNRKPLRPNELSKWELRIEKYRVFYDVNLKNKTVKIKAIGWKEHNNLFIRGRKFEL